MIGLIPDIWAKINPDTGYPPYISVLAKYLLHLISSHIKDKNVRIPDIHLTYQSMLDTYCIWYPVRYSYPPILYWYPYYEMTDLLFKKEFGHPVLRPQGGEVGYLELGNVLQGPHWLVLHTAIFAYKRYQTGFNCLKNAVRLYRAATQYCMSK